jgi:hypothetical protein
MAASARSQPSAHVDSSAATDRPHLPPRGTIWRRRGRHTRVTLLGRCRWSRRDRTSARFHSVLEAPFRRARACFDSHALSCLCATIAQFVSRGTRTQKQRTASTIARLMSHDVAFPIGVLTPAARHVCGRGVRNDTHDHVVNACAHSTICPPVSSIRANQSAPQPHLK